MSRSEEPTASVPSEETGELDQNKSVVDLPARFKLLDKDGTVLEGSDCKISVGTQLLAVASPGGERHEFAYREIIAVEPQRYTLKIDLDGFSFSFDYLGNKYDDLTRLVFNLRNDQFARDLLVDEGQPSASVIGRIEYVQGGEGPSLGEVRVYKTRLGFFPNEGDMRVARFSDISSSKFEDYVATFTMNDLTVKVSQMGRNYEYLAKSFQSANTELQRETTSLIREVCPTISFTSLSKLSRMMLDGNAVRYRDAEAVAPDFAKSFQIQLEAGDDEMLKCMQHLLSDIGDSDNSLIGLKKLVSNYLYLLIPLKGANVVAQETNEKGHATYFYKAKPEEMHYIVEGLREVNFRREPIYLSDNDFLKPQYSRYSFALLKLGAMRELRKRFIGRAIHADYDTWKSQVDNLSKAWITES